MNWADWRQQITQLFHFQRLRVWANPGQWRRGIAHLPYLLHETSLGLRRGGWMNWAAISTVTVLLFLLGMGLQTSWQVNGLLQQVGSQLQISVYLRPDVSGVTVQPLVAQLPQVKQVELISKEQAWQSLLKDLGASEIAGANQGLAENPLVDELRVEAHRADQVGTLAQALSKIEGVAEVQYLDQALKNLAQLNQGLNQMGLALVGLLTVTAIAVISTTIRLIVMARQRDIEVMQLVGATTTWIYLPFIFQGIGFGLAGAAIAWGMILLIQQALRQLLSQQSFLLQGLGEGLHLTGWQTVLLPLTLVGLGILVGFLGSLLAVRRFAVR
jgi:cell division transport system permease protein